MGGWEKRRREGRALRVRTMLVIPTLFGVDIGRWDGGGGGAKWEGERDVSFGMYEH